ncbi:hypothetical protein IJZ97_01710 [bacterium]|nr:hypothetical protein [bacterium]
MVNTKPFGDFTTKREYYLTPKIAQDIYDKKDQDSAKKGKKVGIIVASASILATLAVFAVTRGLPKSTYRKLADLIQHLEENVNRRKANGESGPVTSFFNYSLKKLNSFADRAQSVNNFNMYKDIMAKKVMYKTKFTQKIHDNITAFFEKLSLKTVGNSYKNADRKFNGLQNAFGLVNDKILAENPSRVVTINGVSKKASEWVDEIANRQRLLSTNYNDGFGNYARQGRHKFMKKANENLGDKVWEISKNGIEDLKDMKNNVERLKTSKAHQEFIADNILKQPKNQISKDIEASRRLLTHDIKDSFNAGNQILDEISDLIQPNDAEAAKILKQLRANFANYKSLSGSKEADYRKILNSEITENLNTLLKRVQHPSETISYNKETVGKILGHVNEISDVLAKSEKGELQEILTIYKALLPREEYVKLRGQSNNAIKALDKAIKTESDLFFDKLRDLSAGSGTTDILSLFGSIGGVGLGLTMADNKEERTTALLKYGIPIIGTLATSLVLTVSLVSGIKSMLIGTVSGGLMSLLGTSADKKIKQRNRLAEDNKHAETVKAEIEANSVNDNKTV